MKASHIQKNNIKSLTYAINLNNKSTNEINDISIINLLSKDKYKYNVKIYN